MAGCVSVWFSRRKETVQRPSRPFDAPSSYDRIISKRGNDWDRFSQTKRSTRKRWSHISMLLLPGPATRTGLRDGRPTSTRWTEVDEQTGRPDGHPTNV